MKFKSFSHIDGFAKAIKGLQKSLQYSGRDEDGNPVYDESKPLPVVKFVGTTKLHGSNCGVVIDFTDNTITAQSRNRSLSVEDDNYGFAKFVKQNEDAFYSALGRVKNPRRFNQIIVYGEWVGSGIQKNVAVSNLDKSWFIFAAKGVDESGNSEWLDISYSNKDARIFTMSDYGQWSVDVDLSNPQNSEEEINKATDEVVNECPVGKAFGIEGYGEGIVWYPLIDGSRYDFAFKTKGDKHEVTKPKTAKIDVPVSNDVIEFVKNAITEERFNQGLDVLRENGKEPDVEHTGEFLSWFVKDAMREEDESLGSLNEKDVKKTLSNEVRKKYISYVNKF